MTKTEAFAKTWSLLDQREKRDFFVVMFVIVVSALSAAAMIGSVLPFLAVLADPAKIQTVPVLNWGYETFGFTSNYSFLIALGLGSLLVILIVNLLQVLKVYVASRFVQMRLHSISNRLLALYLAQPYEFFLDRHSGNIAQSILSESGQIVGSFLRPATDLVASVLTIMSIIGLLFWVDYRVALGAFALFGGVYVTLFRFTRNKLTRLGQLRSEYNGARFRIANETFGGIKDIKIGGRETSILRTYEKPSIGMAEVQVKTVLMGSLPPHFIMPIGYGGIILICLLLMEPTAYDSGQGNLGNILPVLGVFAFASQRLMPELSRLYQQITQMQSGVAAVDRVTRDFNRLQEIQPLPDTPPPPLGLKRSLRMENISYRYPNSDKGGITDISLTIRSGEKIGIVGSTGAGKTTFADILLGLLPPEGAQNFFVDDTAITPDNLRAWQQSVGYVPQNIFLSDASIAHNIAFGVPAAEIDADRVRDCARLAQLDEMVETQLEDGYDTAIGERGVRLSGGQRQRIGIARALYHNADMILFDEATSALDNSTEREVMSAINALPGDKTIVMIAHRLSTVRICDRILVLDQGRVEAFAAWDDLMETSETFRKLVNHADFG
ncbi:MAG: ABC transporter ATP-binding protein [Phaeobacter gallaeciensis]